MRSILCSTVLCREKFKNSSDLFPKVLPSSSVPQLGRELQPHSPQEDAAQVLSRLLADPLYRLAGCSYHQALQTQEKQQHQWIDGVIRFILCISVMGQVCFLSLESKLNMGKQLSLPLLLLLLCYTVDSLCLCWMCCIAVWGGGYCAKFCVL